MAETDPSVTRYHRLQLSKDMQPEQDGAWVLYADVVAALRSCEARIAELSASFCEAHQPPHSTCPCCEAVHVDDLRLAAEARITDLEQQQGAAFGLTQTILGLEDAGDDPDDLVHNLTLIKTRLAARDHQTTALRVLVAEWRAAARRFGVNPFSDASCLRTVANALEAALAAPGPEPVAERTA